VEKVLAKVLELLQAAGQAGGLSFSQASATVRLVCAAWKAVHDALVTRLLLRPQTTDEAMGMLVRRFPTVVSLESKGDFLNHALLTDEALRALSNCTSLRPSTPPPPLACTSSSESSAVAWYSTL
jgi:hypothetical protein